MICNLLVVFLIILLNIINIKGYCNIKDDFNAIGNGIDLDDEALNNALNQCSGERIIFPSGTYLLSPFNLTSNTELYLSNYDSIILASSDYDNWPLVDPLPSYPETSLRVSPFIGGNNVHNISITGIGTIDGNGKVWWDASDNHLLKYGRPRLIEPMYCSNFTISDITILNPGFWAIHPYACDNLLFENIFYSAPLNSPNTDGIDPDSCSNVVITNFTSSCGDDSISVKSGKDEAGRLFNKPSFNILIKNSFIGPSSGINVGSEMSGGVYNITITNTQFKTSLYSLRIKSGRGRGGYVKDIYINNCTLIDMPMAIAINMKYANPDSESNGKVDETTPHIYNVNYSNLHGGALNAGALICLPESPCRDMNFENINITSIINKDKITGFECFRILGTVIGENTPALDSCLDKLSN